MEIKFGRRKTDKKSYKILKIILNVLLTTYVVWSSYTITYLIIKFGKFEYIIGHILFTLQEMQKFVR